MIQDYRRFEMVKKNEIIEVNIDKVNFPNKGIARHEGKEVRFKVLQYLKGSSV